MASKASSPLIHAIIDRPPIRPINCTTFVTTKVIAGDPAHPLNIKIGRKLAAFDPQGFYWRVNCSIDISKKAIVRNTCKGNFKKAFAWALAAKGWGEDGRPLDPNSRTRRLTGAVLLIVAKDPARVLTAKQEDMRRDALDIVKKLAARQGKPAIRKDWPQSELPGRNSVSPGSARSNEHVHRGKVESKTGTSFTNYRPAGTGP